MRAKLILLFILSVGASGCAGNISVSGKWEDPEARGDSLSRVLIVTLARDSSRRTQFDTELALRLRNDNTQVFIASKILDPRIEITRPVIEQLVAENAVDGVIVTRVSEQRVVPKEITDKTDEKRYRSTGQAYGSMDADSTFNFVQYDYKSTIDTKDYTVLKYDLTLATDVYETTRGEIIYEVISQATNQSEPSKMINKLAEKISKQLKRTGLLQ